MAGNRATAQHEPPRPTVYEPPKGYVLLRKAIERNDLGLLERLLEGRPELNVPDEKGETPLHWANALDRPAMAERLRRAGARE